MDEIALRFLEEALKRRMQAATVFEMRDESFPKQANFVCDASQFVAAQCSRRAGKSNGTGYRLLRKARKYPNSIVPYIALTRESARNIMWPVFYELNEKYNLGAVMTESNLTVTLPNQARVVCFGADMKNFIQRLRGPKYPEAAVDEGQAFGDHLRELIEDILVPATADYEDGAITLTGTPGPVPRGYFYDACMGREGFSLHKWTLLENPYMPRARQFIDELKKKKGWDDRNPTYLREWCNEWVTDLEALLIKYSEERNHYESLPQAHWNYILGVDIGIRDADALAVIGWSESTPNIYLVEERITPEQDITLLSNQMSELIAKYDIAKIVMDEGGLGKKVAEEIRRRKGIPVQPADKQRKMENVAFLNDYLRLGKFYAHKKSRFAYDSYQVQIDWDKTTPDRLVVKSGFHSDIIDAVLYAFKESPAYTYQKPIEKPAWGTDKWAEEEVDRMVKAEIEGLTREEDPMEGYGWGSEW